MSIELELPPELAAELAAAAAKQGLSLEEYALHLLASAKGSSPQNGAELIAYWQRQGLIGTRNDIVDGPAHARAIREKAQQRARS